MIEHQLLPKVLKDTGIRSLNLGCGPEKKEGFLNVDREIAYNPDVCIDLDEAWPFPSGWFYNIICEHTLEHIKDVPRFMNLCHEILGHKGALSIIVPYWSGKWATGDPTHIHFFNEDSFNGWTSWADRYFHLNQGHWFKELHREELRDPDGAGLNNRRDRGFGNVLGLGFLFEKIERKV